MINQDTPQQNHLLGALPADQYERLFSHLEGTRSGKPARLRSGAPRSDMSG